MALDQATQDFLTKATAAATKPRHLLTPGEARAAFAGLRAVLGHGCGMARETDLRVPVSNGQVPVRLFVPHEEPAALLIYFHGGGWVVGTVEEFSPFCREIAGAAGIAVALVEYRKAPEYPFPGPIEDAWDVTQWFGTHGKDVLGSELPLVVGGDSAGGNLAIVVTHRARRNGEPTLTGQLLIYPVTDCRLDTPSYLDTANNLMTNTDTMAAYWSHYVPDAAQRDHPEASPLQADDLRGLPPAMVITAEHDVLRDEGESYGERLREAGVPVTLRRFEGQMHGFMMMVGLVPGARAGIDYVGVALRRLIQTSPAAGGIQ